MNSELEMQLQGLMVGKFTIQKRFMHLLKKVLLAIFVIVFCSGSLAFGSQQNERKKVLVLFSFRPTLPVASQWTQGIRSVFESNKDINPVINIEYLDLTHFGDEQYVNMLLELYRYKYSNPTPDLIIPVLNSSVDLMLKYGEKLFPGTPIVFGGVESQFINNRSLRPNITGHLTDIDYKGTLELALNLHNHTRNVVVVAGAGQVVRKWTDSCRKMYKAYEDRYNFTYLTILPMANLLEKVKKLPPNTIVISLPVLVDGSGKEFVGNESLTLISQASTAPVYTFWDVCVGTGVVGGYMSSFVEEAKAVAELGLRVLNGEKPQAVPIIQAPKFSYMFDWCQLKRWSISEDRLPPDSIVMFKELSTWDKYKGRIIGAFALIVFQALFIFYMLYQRRIKRKVEQRYRTVADYTYDWEYWQDPDGSLQYVSPSCERICGYSDQELMANPSLLQDMIVPEDKAVWDLHRCNIQSEMRSEEIQFRVQKPDGEIRWIEHACQPVFDKQGKDLGVRVSNRDITQREMFKSESQQLQSELAHIDRVVTISAMTTALAHEINQPLAAMRSYAQAALRFLDGDQPDMANVRKALKGVVADNKRASAVVNRLRDLVKKKTTYKENLDINQAIKDVITLINSEIVMRNTVIQTDLTPSVPCLHGDVVQIQQVMMNLLTNAMDAMDDVPVEKRILTVATGIKDDRYIVVSISDAGQGIAPDRLKAVFIPFNSTKAKGLGLGLAISQSIITSHGGWITAENNPNGGATFTLILPITLVDN